MKSTRKAISMAIILVLAVSSLPVSIFSTPVRGMPAFAAPGVPHKSAISASDLYSEQIQAYLAGSYSLIRQSAVTNNTSVLNGIPLADPAFLNASFVLFMSNGIYPQYYADPYTPSNEIASFQIPVDGIYFFLSYNATASVATARAAQVKAFMQAAFGIELFQFSNTTATAFTYYGVAPASWNSSISELTAQLPMDGYFGDLDQARITSSNYTATHHLSGGVISINPYGGSLVGTNFATGFAQIMTIFNNSASFISQLSTIGLNFSTVLGSAQNSAGKIAFFTGRTNVVFVQYEGNPQAIAHAGLQYTFDLKKALDVPASDNIEPSGLIWQSLLNKDPAGILSSAIAVSVITGDISAWSLGSPHLAIDDRLLNAAYLFSDLTNNTNLTAIVEELDFVIQNVYFITGWQKTGALDTLTTNVNMTQAGIMFLLAQSGFNPASLAYVLNNIKLDSSPLGLAGFNGLPIVPTGLLRAIPDVNVTYTIRPSEAQPILVIKQQTALAIKPFQQSLNMSMTITNIGSATAWGFLIGHGTANLSSLVTTLSGFTVPKGYTIQYEVRGFSIPSLSQINYLGAYYGAENLLLEYNTLTGSGASTWINRMHLLDTNNDGFLDLHEVGLLGSTAPINYIPVHGSIMIDLSSLAVAGQFTPFTNETGMFSTATIINGVQQGPYPSMAAKTTNGVTWNVASVPITGQDDITINFTFSNSTKNMKQNETAALGFTYVGSLNTSIYGAGKATFAIYNCTSKTWVQINNLVTPAVSINHTGQLPTITTFRIVNGSKDTLNHVINIRDFMQGQNNTVTLQLQAVNNVTTLDQIDSMSMNYLQENKSVLPIAAKVVGYTDLSGIVLRQATSNSLYGGATNASVLQLTQQIFVNDNICYPGHVENLTSSVVNVGTENAENVNFTMILPGIILNPGNFTVMGGLLVAKIPSLAPNAMTSFTFQFEVPNSETVPGMIVAYNNVTKVTNKAPDYTTTANDLYIDAPVQYTSTANTKPFIIPVNATMALKTKIPTTTSSTFVIACNLSAGNLPSWMTFLNVSVQKTPYFTSSGPSYSVVSLTSMAGSFLKNLTKVSYQGYLFPPIALATNRMSALMRLTPVSALQLGSVNITVQKIVTYNDGSKSSAFTMIRGDDINVTVTLTNTGTLPVGVAPPALVVNDSTTFNSAGFVVVSGSDLATNITLAPGASHSFTYVLQAKAVGTFSINSTRITYFFLVKQTTTSTSFTVNVQEQPLVIAMYIGIAAAATVILIILGWKKKHRTLPKSEKHQASLSQSI
ncbi:MAG TPA: BatD family protein [Candidatus Lokiarchaeia archaeon]|nr:BatD family protein [Candidatus Lokiarchaeia archaeon]